MIALPLALVVLGSAVQVDPKPQDLEAFMEKWEKYESLKVPMDAKDEPLILAALQKQPQGPWAQYLLMKFAQVQFHARELQGNERSAAYKTALGYLRPAAETLEKAARAKPDDMTIQSEAKHLTRTVAEASFEAGLDLAPIKASALASLAGNKDPKSWEYGNILFDTHTLLGRVALREGKIDDAKTHLLEAGKTPGSPQLDSFGPRMTLADELLSKGEKETVLKFLELCGNFWKSQEGQLDDWAKAIKEGRKPDFGRHRN